MERKQILLAIAIIILSLGGIMAISGCDNKATAPSDHTITVPSDNTVEKACSSAVSYQDALVLVKDSDGKLKEGIKVKIYEHGSFGNFYTNNSHSAALAGPYEDVTDGSGTVLVNYNSAVFPCLSSEKTYTFGFRAQSGSVSASTTTTVTVPSE